MDTMTVIEIIRENFNIKLTPKSLLKGNLTSIDLAELVIYLEEELGIEIPDKEAEKFITVGDIIKCVNSMQSMTQ